MENEATRLRTALETLAADLREARSEAGAQHAAAPYGSPEENMAEAQLDTINNIYQRVRRILDPTLPSRADELAAELRAAFAEAPDGR